MSQGNATLYDYSKLRGKIVEVFGTLQKFGIEMGWSARTNSLKLNNKAEWGQQEILKAINLLGVPESEINLYFFAL